MGFRLAVRHPERVRALVVQNANAYEVGLSPAMDAARPAWERRTPETEATLRGFLTLETTRFQYLHGARDPSLVSPDAWLHAQAGLDRPGNEAIQLAYLHDYGSNPRQYPAWQDYLRRYQPPTLVGWVRNEPDGSVLAHVEGEPDIVNDMVVWLRHGPPASIVRAKAIMSWI